MHIVPPSPDIADRMEVTYTCASAHEFTRVFAADITAPATWECPRCGKMGSCEDGPMPNDSSSVQRSHWDMLAERRTMDELAEMLAERVKQLRSLR